MTKARGDAVGGRIKYQNVVMGLKDGENDFGPFRRYDV